MPQPLMWSPEDNFQESVLSFHPVGSRDHKLLYLTATP